MMKDMFGDDSEEEDSEKDGASGSSDKGEDSEDSCEDGSAGGKNEGKSGGEGESEKGESGDSKNKSESSETSDGLEGGYGNPFGNRGEMSGPVSHTDENFRSKEEEMADMSDKVSIPQYLTFPTINTNAVVVDYKKVHEELTSHYAKQEGAIESGVKLLKKFKSTNDKMVSYMTKEFEMKKAADIHRRAYNSKKGTLDMNKIHAYKYSENLFQQITSFPEGKNHGMVMFNSIFHT
jgi:hypothetical protein